MVNLVPYGLFLWFPVVLLLFAKLPRHRAVIVACVAGFLFLPEVRDPVINPEAPAAVPIPFLPMSKLNVIGLSILLAAAVFDWRRLLAFRPHWFDVPMVVWCLCPFLSAITNEPVADPLYVTPAYDGISQTRIQTLNWGVPYFIGRLYFNDADSCRELAVGIVLGGLLYAPLCLFELRMSPQLHKWIYGFYQHDPSQAIRDGGFRPTVLLEHGLSVAMWMVAAALLGFWLWRDGTLSRLSQRLGLVPAGWLLLLLLAATAGICLKSKGALLLGVVGVAAVFAARRVSGQVVLAGLLAIAPFYIIGRVGSCQEPTGWLRQKYSRWVDQEELKELEKKALAKPMFIWGWWSSQDVIDAIRTRTGEAGDYDEEEGGGRGASYAFRLVNEDRLMERVQQKPVFGWGGWNRTAIPMTEDPEKADVDMITADGLWILTLANRGYVGLVALYVAMLLPVVRFVWRQPRRDWIGPTSTPAVVVAVILTLHMIDNVTNAMYNPIFILMAGALAGWSGVAALQRVPAQRDTRPVPLPRREGVLSRPRPFVG